MLNAKIPGDFFADCGMIAASAFGNVMEHCGKVQNFGFGNHLKNIVAERQFVAVLFQGETAQIANHEKGMLVHRVNMKKIVLHSGYDVGEAGKIGGENAVSVHAAQLRRDAPGLTKNLNKKPIGRFVFPEIVIDQIKASSYQSNRRSSDPF